MAEVVKAVSRWVKPGKKVNGLLRSDHVLHVLRTHGPLTRPQIFEKVKERADIPSIKRLTKLLQMLKQHHRVFLKPGVDVLQRTYHFVPGKSKNWFEAPAAMAAISPPEPVRPARIRHKEQDRQRTVQPVQQDQQRTVPSTPDANPASEPAS